MINVVFHVLLFIVGCFASIFFLYRLFDNFSGKDCDPTLHGVAPAIVLSWVLDLIDNKKWLLWYSKSSMAKVYAGVPFPPWLFMGFLALAGNQHSNEEDNKLFSLIFYNYFCQVFLALTTIFS